MGDHCIDGRRKLSLSDVVLSACCGPRVYQRIEAVRQYGNQRPCRLVVLEFELGISVCFGQNYGCRAHRPFVADKNAVTYDWELCDRGKLHSGEDRSDFGFPA